MKSPFPGMDPYLEKRWGEVHASLIVYARNQLNQQLPDDLQASIEQSVAVYVDDEHSHSLRPDMHVSEDNAGPQSSQTSITDVAVAEPLVLPMVPRTERHVEIVDDGGRVITAIEFLSPGNKIGDNGRSKYARKQANYLSSGANLVEIDLVRQGSYVLAAPDEMIPENLKTPYWVCVYRQDDPDNVEVYRVPLRESLPNIPIPLRPYEKDAVLQLQPLIDDCYRDGRYHRTNYQLDPEPQLSDEDADWMNSLLKENGHR
ncbi:MAG: hypothetical protein CMJ78_02600 [Planctomycetaceae bacterium]|nr:hypothetical protein [Planctomycetaceae bacterium]